MSWPTMPRRLLTSTNRTSMLNINLLLRKPPKAKQFPAIMKSALPNIGNQLNWLLLMLLPNTAVLKLLLARTAKLDLFIISSPSQSLPRLSPPHRQTKIHLPKILPTTTKSRPLLLLPPPLLLLLLQPQLLPLQTNLRKRRSRSETTTSTTSTRTPSTASSPPT